MRGAAEMNLREEEDRSEQICFLNPRPDGGDAPSAGGCLNPEPSAHHRLAALWAAFQSWKISLRFSPLDGRPDDPFNIANLRGVVEIYGETLDSWALEFLYEWISGYLDNLPKPKTK